MKCPICNGKGTQFIADYDGMYDIVCDKCKGKGELDENGKPILTNEEYLKSCTTEMLAVAIFRAICTSAEMIRCEITLENRSGTELKEAIYEWLKQPHK